MKKKIILAAVAVLVGLASQVSFADRIVCTTSNDQSDSAKCVEGVTRGEWVKKCSNPKKVMGMNAPDGKGGTTYTYLCDTK